MIDLSIVIVNWNTRDWLARSLASVWKEMQAAQALQAEVLVVDNASSDGSVDMVCSCFPWVRLIQNEVNVGFAPANNQAIAQSHGRYVVLLNSDTEVYPGALETMVQFMEEHSQAGGCGPMLLNSDGSFQVSCHPLLTPGREFWRLVFLEGLWRRATYAQEGWSRDMPKRVEVIKGACLMLRRKGLEDVGLLDERYFMYSEEMDLCYRLAQAGWQLWWVPRATVKHHGEASSRQVAEAMYVQLYRSKVQFHDKFGGRRQASRFKRLVGLAYAPRLLVAVLAALGSPDWVIRKHVYRRLLAELPRM